MTSTRGAQILKVLMGLSLIVMGSGATLYLWGSSKRALETRSWTPVPAMVFSSQILTDRPSLHSPLNYIADVHYRYTWEGKTLTSTRIRRPGAVVSPHKEKVEAVVAEYPPGKPATCYVNPAQPDHAILRHESRVGPLMAAFFPLLFVAGGIGMVISAFRSGSKAPAAPSPP